MLSTRIKVLHKFFTTHITQTIRTYSTGSSFPYGVASFEGIRNEKKFFVDNTKFIPLLEKEGKTYFSQDLRDLVNLFLLILSLTTMM